MPLIFRFFAVLRMTNITIYTMDSNLIFGIRPVAEAIEAGKQIEKLYIRKGAEGQLMQELKDLCMRHRLHYQEVPVEKLNRLTRGNHQGVVAQTAAIEYVQLTDILESRTYLQYIIDEIYGEEASC